jgi:hypothetical protein
MSPFPAQKLPQPAFWRTKREQQCELFVVQIQAAIFGNNSRTPHRVVVLGSCRKFKHRLRNRTRRTAPRPEDGTHVTILERHAQFPKGGTHGLQKLPTARCATKQQPSSRIDARVEAAFIGTRKQCTNVLKWLPDDNARQTKSGPTKGGGPKK